MGDEWEANESEEAPSEPWHTDRSRYMAGYDCPWKRLMQYHAFGTGINGGTSLPLAVGIDIHATLEKMLKFRMNPDNKLRGEDVIIDQQQVGNMLTVSELDRIQPGEGEITDQLQDARDISIAIPHAFARIAMPWLDENFEILGVEQEMTHKHQIKLHRDMPTDNTRGDEPARMRQFFQINFNLRPDFTARDKNTGKVTVHDFKTASSFQEAREMMTYADNVQMMINSMGVKEEESLTYYPDYYVHILLKGNNWSRSPLIHAHLRQAAPPMQAEDWQPKFWLPPDVVGGKKRSIGRAYSKQRVSLLRPISDWVWSMPSQVCAESIIILGPFNVVSEKTQQFMRGLPTNEQTWLERLQDLDWSQWAEPDFQFKLDQLFPRTFKCYNYGSRCSFYSLCFKGPGWDKPFDNGYVEREPHHIQEPKGELIR